MDEYGIQFDRAWMLVKLQEDGSPARASVTQKVFPKLCLVETRLEGEKFLIIKAPNQPELKVKKEDAYLF